MQGNSKYIAAFLVFPLYCLYRLLAETKENFHTSIKFAPNMQFQDLWCSHMQAPKQDSVYVHAHMFLWGVCMHTCAHTCPHTLKLMHKLQILSVLGFLHVCLSIYKPFGFL